MRVVILTETFAGNMGYIGNMLPKYLARLGVDVHVISMDLPPYYYFKNHKGIYGDFFDSSSLAPGKIEVVDGYTRHILSHKKQFGYMRMRGLKGKLRSLRPDIVQTFPSIGWIPLDAAINKFFLGYKLFTGSHTTASSFPLANRTAITWDRDYIECMLKRFVPGRIISLFTEKCYGVTTDCADIAVRFFGVQRKKIEVMHLGVDADVFFPVNSDESFNERKALRQKLGFSDDEIVCIYTGKMTESKNALILAKAIDRLRSMGKQFRGVFIGGGVQKESIREYPWSVVIDFMPFGELGAFYRAADIGVWPTDESTSTLDVAACGIPVVISNEIIYRKHIEGNGVTYKLKDVDDLVEKLLGLRDRQERERLGSFGAEKMASSFSWESIAKRRLADYKIAIDFNDETILEEEDDR